MGFFSNCLLVGCHSSGFEWQTLLVRRWDRTLEKHRLRCGLKTLLLIVAAIGAFAGQFGKYYRHKRAENAAMREIRRAGGVLIHASSFDRKLEFRDGRTRDGVFRFLPLVSSVVEVRITRGDVTEALLKHLSALHEVRRISLRHSRTSSDGMVHLANLPNLEQLDLQSTDIHDAALSDVAHIENLTSLNLGFTGISDEGISHLHALANLRQLGLEGTQVTQAAIDLIVGAIPGLHVYRGPQVERTAKLMAVDGDTPRLAWLENRLMGDASDDGAVNFSDLIALASNFGAIDAVWELGDSRIAWSTFPTSLFFRLLSDTREHASGRSARPRRGEKSGRVRAFGASLVSMLAAGSSG